MSSLSSSCEVLGVSVWVADTDSDMDWWETEAVSALELLSLAVGISTDGGSVLFARDVLPDRSICVNAATSIPGLDAPPACGLVAGSSKAALFGRYAKLSNLISIESLCGWAPDTSVLGVMVLLFSVFDLIASNAASSSSPELSVWNGFEECVSLKDLG